MQRRARVIGAALATGVLGSALLAGTSGAGDGDGGKPFRLAMSGANEFNAAGAPINPHGDADRGSITLRLKTGHEQVCWSAGELSLTAGEALPHAGHIHAAPAGVAGPVVIDLFAGNPPASYPTDTACVPAARDLLRAIKRDPAAYYVNLHNAQHPGGVVRAQLG